MIVRNICSESANHSRLLGGNKINTFNALIHLGGDKFPHGAFAFSAIKITPIMGQNFPGPPGASVYGSFGCPSVNVVTDANDHENHLQEEKNIVKQKCE